LAGNLGKSMLAYALLVVPVSLSGARTAEPIDINRASMAELLTVPGMTATWAQRIVRFRPYRTKLDLVERGVVTQEVYQRIRDGVVAHRVMPEKTASPDHR
jgi:competence protein ComEA